MSIALAHKRKVRQQQKEAEEAKANSGSASQATESDSQINQSDLVKSVTGLDADLVAIKAVRDHGERDELKKEMVEKYRPAATEIMANYQSWKHQKLVFWWLMWRLNVEGFEAVQPDMMAGIEKGLTTEEPFKRDWPTFYLDQVNEFTNSGIKSEKEFNLDYLNEAVEMLNDGRLQANEAIKSKLYVHHGKLAYQTGDFKTAVDSFEKAMKYNKNAGVKTLLKSAKEKV